MYVIKRSGKREEVILDKITARIKKLCYGLDPKYVNHMQISLKVVQGLYDGVTTTELDNLAAETAASMTTVHPDFAKLAARIAISNLHKNTDKSFSKTMAKLRAYIDPKTNEPAALISEEVAHIVETHKDVLDSAIIYDRDYNFDFFGFKTLERSYLLKMDGQVQERPQQMLMRVALGIHGEDIDAAIETYRLMSEKWFIHATPTLFNAGTPKAQLSSCFLLSMQEDSIEGIYDTLKQCALISQSAGGIGLSIHNIRATGSYIKGTNGNSNGIIPMLRVFNDTARYVDQCFHPDTIVYTKQGIKKIDDIVVGEEMLTEDGSYNAVGRLLRSDYKGKMIELSVKQSIDPIRVTPEHPFYVLRNQQKMINFDVIRNRLDKGYAQPEWVEAKDLTENDLVLFPMSEYENDIDHYDLDDCRMYGMMLGDGHIAKDGRAAHITMNTETDDLNFVRRYLYEHGIHYTLTEKDKKTRFTWSAHLGFKFSRAMLYDHEGQKMVHPSMLHLSKDKTLQIVKGLIEADGWISSRENFEIAIEMTSRNVIESIRFMLMRWGILTSGYPRDRRGNVSSYKEITTKQITYCLRIPKVKEVCSLFDIPAGKYTSYLQYGNHCYSRVTGVNEIDYEGVVVDFEVLPNHNYVTHVGITHNGGGKRKGAFAIYLEPWHADVFEFLDLKKNHGKEELRARDLFYALWVPDLFMKRVKEDGEWSLFCPHEAPGLFDSYGDKFEEIYAKHEASGIARRTVPARELWNKILESQIETGTPYILYKDHANNKSNQKNLGTIRSSNLCTEVMEYTSKDEIAVCNLASLSLGKFVTNDGQYDHQKLFEVTKVVTRNLNKVIDINYYPVPEAKNSNMRHRPIGIGVQGLADTFALLRIAFDSEEARTLNRDIFETIYFGALTASMEEAKVNGPYESYEGSPSSKGILQYDMWNITPTDRWDWAGLKAQIAEHGLRNSLLVAPMPTASTSQILGNNECFEPFTSNLYTRRTLSGEFVVINKYLLKDLIEMGIWNNTMKDRLIAANGSVQNIPEIPESIKELYKTTWELSQKVIIDMAADRGAYICQSQSMNIFLENANYKKMTSMHFYAWQKGLKTGMYYLRTKAATDAIKFTVDREILEQSVAEGNTAATNIVTQRIETETATDTAPVAAAVAVSNGSNGTNGSNGSRSQSTDSNEAIQAISLDDIDVQACRLDDPDCEACSA